MRRYKPMENHDYFTYEEFGRKFFEVAVTPERVADRARRNRGQRVRDGADSSGARRRSRRSAPTLRSKIPGSRAASVISSRSSSTFPSSIDLLLDLRLDKQRFAVTGDIALRATARAAEPLVLIVDVAKPRPSDITVNVSSSSIRGEVVRIIGGVDGEIRRFIAQYVADEIDAPQSQAAQKSSTSPTRWTPSGAVPKSSKILSPWVYAVTATGYAQPAPVMPQGRADKTVTSRCFDVFGPGPGGSLEAGL